MYLFIAGFVFHAICPLVHTPIIILPELDMDVSPRDWGVHREAREASATKKPHTGEAFLDDVRLMS